MFDIAKVKVPELNPDLMIFAFITDDITRKRIWRTVAMVEGRKRVFTTTEPKQIPDLRKAADTVVINPDVTLEWCAGSPKPSRKTDSTVREIEYRKQLAAELLVSSREDLYTTQYSFLFDLIRYGTPFQNFYLQRFKKGIGVNPRHNYYSFLEDFQLKEAVADLRKLEIPIMVIHLATRQELWKESEYFLQFDHERQVKLLESLEKVVGVKY